MIGRTIMNIDREEMKAIVQHYLNSNLLNTTFQRQHTSGVLNVRQRGNGRFVIEFIQHPETTKTMTKAATGGGQ